MSRLPAAAPPRGPRRPGQLLCRRGPPWGFRQRARAQNALLPLAAAATFASRRAAAELARGRFARRTAFENHGDDYEFCADEYNCPADVRDLCALALGLRKRPTRFPLAAFCSLYSRRRSLWVAIFRLVGVMCPTKSAKVCCLVVCVARGPHKWPLQVVVLRA